MVRCSCAAYRRITTHGLRWETMSGTLNIALSISARLRRTRTSVTATFIAPTVRSLYDALSEMSGCQTSGPSTTPVGQQDFQTVQTIITLTPLASVQCPATTLTVFAGARRWAI